MPWPVCVSATAVGAATTEATTTNKVTNSVKVSIASVRVRMRGLERGGGVLDIGWRRSSSN